MDDLLQNGYLGANTVCPGVLTKQIKNQNTNIGIHVVLLAMGNVTWSQAAIGLDQWTQGLFPERFGTKLVAAVTLGEVEARCSAENPCQRGPEKIFSFALSCCGYQSSVCSLTATASLHDMICRGGIKGVSTVKQPALSNTEIYCLLLIAYVIFTPATSLYGNNSPRRFI